MVESKVLPLAKLLTIPRVKLLMPSAVLTVGGNQSVEELRRELAEAREQQTATADILRVISSSPTDLQRVFAEIATSAARLCDAYDAVIRQVDGEGLRLVAHHGPLPTSDTIPVSRSSVVGCAVIDRRTIHVADLQSEANEYAESRNRALQLGHRTALYVPLVYAGEAVGVILIRRTEVHPFTDRQIDLLKTFADQAVIAIENARLFEEVQQKNRALIESNTQLTETLEQQTASSEILRVISTSSTNLQPVLDTVVKSAARFCGAPDASIFRLDGGNLRADAHHGPVSQPTGFLVPVVRGTVAGRAVLERRAIHVTDLQAEIEEFPEGSALSRQIGQRAMLVAPLLLEGAPTGVIVLRRAEAVPFTDKQIALLKTFADQAVIAIENTRLFEEVQARTRELTEALEQQTATSDVLSAISSSPGELEPVFDAMLSNAVRICAASYGALWIREGRTFRNVAFHGALSKEFTDKWRQTVIPPGSSLPLARVIETQKPVHIADMREHRSYLDGQPLAVTGVDIGGIRTMLLVPMLKEKELVGAVAIYRKEVRSFSDKHVDLVSNFAKQAVIAIENTRLLSELRESLEHQTATSEVLGVISRSPTNVQPVFDMIAQSAARVCDARHCNVFRFDGQLMHFAASYGLSSEAQEMMRSRSPMPGGRGSVAGRAIEDNGVAEIQDIPSDEGYQQGDIAKVGDYRSAIAVPMRKDGRPIGAIALTRREPEPFPQSQIDLLKTFADQAVIAIENARLFEEIAQKSRELEIASAHKSQFVANMSHELRTPLAAILGYAELMQEGFYEPLGQKSLDALTRIRSNGKHLLGLINTVLDIAKIESGQFNLNLGEYALENVIETVRAATDALAESKKLSLKTEVAKSLPIGLGDEQRLTQVLLNLVGNAMKFTDAGEVRIAATALDGQFAVSVADTGPGIPQQHLARIFEQFHQVDSSNTKAKGGTGLGLAITKKIVEMHGGRIWVESMLGKGSNFRIELPVRAQHAKTTK